MPPKNAYKFDVFVSYARQDKAWIEENLLPRLKPRGLKLFIDYMDFKPGKSELGEIERGIKSSRKTLLLISPHYLKDKFSDFEKHLTRYMGMKDQEIRCIPVIIAPCRLPDDIKYLVYVTLTSKNEQEREEEWKKLLNSLTEEISDKPISRKRKLSGTKSISLPRMEKELRMNRAHWVNSGFSIPADQFSFTAVYFENQLEIFKNLRTAINSLADDVSYDQNRPRQPVFLKRAYEVLDKLHSSTNQVVSILETDKDQQLLLKAHKATKRLFDNTLKARQSLMKSSVGGTLHPRSFDSIAAQLPTELQAVCISIDELEKYLKQIYRSAGKSAETEIS